MHSGQTGNGAGTVFLVKVHNVVLVRDQLMRARQAGTGSALEIGIGQLFHLVINQQPHDNGCTCVVLRNPALNRIEMRRGIQTPINTQITRMFDECGDSLSLYPCKPS
jgi:hypothetical protein